MSQFISPVLLPADPTQALEAATKQYVDSVYITLGTTTINARTTVLSLAGLVSIAATTFTGALVGNASTATALQTARTIGLSGVTATPTGFDGSANIVIPITGVPTSLLSGILAAGQMPALTGDVTNVAGTLASTISNGAVSLVKLANLAATSLIGNSSGSAAAPTAISIGSGLSLTSGVLSATGAGTGTVTSVSVITANGVSGLVNTATTTPAITLTLGDITPTSVASSGNITITGGVLNVNRTSTDYNAISLINSGGVQVQMDANGNAEGGLRTTTNHPMTFYTNNTLRLTLDTAGNATFSGNVNVLGQHSLGQLRIVNGDPNYALTYGALNQGTWIASTAVTVNEIWTPTVSNGYSYRCTTAGTTGTTQPTWPTTPNSTVVDNGVVWTIEGRCFAGLSLDGPALYGYSAGALGTTNGGDKWALRWDSSSNVFTNGRVSITAPGGISIPAWGGIGGLFNVQPNGNMTDTSTPASTVVAGPTVTSSFYGGSYTATNTVVTYTDVASVYIGNLPTAGTNLTFTNRWALWANGGITLGNSLAASITDLTKGIALYGGTGANAYGLVVTGGTLNVNSGSTAINFNLSGVTQGVLNTSGLAITGGISATNGLTVTGGNLSVSTGSITANGYLLAQGSSSNSIYLELNNSIASGRNWAIGSSGGGIGPVGDLVIYDSTAGAARMLIDASGNTTFNQAVTVDGQLIPTGSIANFTVNSTAGPLIYESDSTNHQLGIRTGPSTAYTYFTFDQNGNFHTPNGGITSAGIISANNSILSTGAVSFVGWVDRTTNLQWGNYASGGQSYLYNATNGIVFTTDVAGNSTSKGNITAGGTIAATNYQSNDAGSVDLNTVIISGFYRLEVPTANASPAGNYSQMIVSRGAGDTLLQINADYASNKFCWRSAQGIGSTATWYPWRTMWHDGNFTPANYALLSGATFTGNVTVIGIGSFGQNTNGTAKIDAYSGRAYFGCNTAANGVQIDSNGYVYVNYINTTANIETAVPANVAIQTGDNYLRWQTPAQFKINMKLCTDGTLIENRFPYTTFQNTSLRSGIFSNDGNGLYNAAGTAVTLPGWWHVISNYHDTNGFGSQIATELSGYGTNGMWIRSSSGTTWKEWSQVALLDRAVTYAGAVTATNFIQNDPATNPQTAPGNAAYLAQGNYGGGYGMIDGSYGISLYSASGTLNFGFGSNTSVASKATLDTNGNLTVNGTINAGSNGFYCTWPVATGTIANGGNGGNYGYTAHANNNGGGAAASCAAITFIRDGAFGCYFGLDTDSQLKIGGWSFGNASYKILHEGLASFSSNNPAGFGRLFAGFDSGVAGSVSCNNWFRSTSGNGWYDSTNGGGIYMTDTTYVRAYNGKSMAAADFVITSDKNAKHDIRPFEFKGRLTPRHFTLNEKNKPSFGFIAQEVRKLYPEAVSNEKNEKYLSLSYNLLTAVIAHQVNTLEDELFVVKEDMSTMKRDMNSMHSEIHQMRESVKDLVSRFH